MSFGHLKEACVASHYAPGLTSRVSAAPLSAEGHLGHQLVMKWLSSNVIVFHWP